MYLCSETNTLFMKNILIFSLMTSLLIGCSKSKVCNSPPSTIYFKIIKNNQEYLGSKVDSLQIFYDKNGVKNNITDLVWLKQIDSSLISPTNVLFSSQMSTISGSENIHQFFFQFPNNDIDTLNYKTAKVTNSSSNCTYYQISELSYNGKIVGMDVSLSSLYVHKFVE